ncbi:MAG: ATP-binding protein [Pseudomonadota bacterium]
MASRVMGTLARRHPGTGLGLALVKRQAELHGGAVDLHSELGKGSTFTVWLLWRTCADRSVALTALAMSGDRARVDAAGCDGYVSKPPQYQELLRVVRELLAPRTG